MRKIKLLCGLLLLALTLTACGGEQSVNEPFVAPTEQPDKTVTDTAAGAYRFQSGDHTVGIDDDMADVLAALGEPKSYFEAESCAFQGLDKTYTYPGFVITTRPDGEKDYVSSIVLTDDSVTTPEGVYIGSTAQEVENAYGKSADSTEFFLSYAKDGACLNFIMEGGKVLSIEYLADGA